MKYLCILLFGILASSTYAQKCTREGEFYNSIDISTEGGVSVVKNKKGKLVIKIDNKFKTQEGPDLDVYLSTTQKVEEGKSLRVDKLFALEAAQRYTTKEEVAIDQYNYVVIHCTKWNHWYGSAKLGDVADCK